VATSVCIDHLETKDVQALYGLMKDLHPHLKDGSEFVERVQRQRANGYRLLCAWASDCIVGAAGYRLHENLLYGPYVYIDDLVISRKHRRNGIGTRLIDAMTLYAQEHGCRYLVLDTRIHMRVAHRFHFRQGFSAHAVHFTQRLKVDDPDQALIDLS
jgi:ribosomal protein S18 acetylase RimI-like enzyme